MKRYSFLWVVLLAIAPGFVQADQSSAWDVDAPTSSLQYTSSLGDYQSYHAAKVGSWTERNTATTDSMKDDSPSTEQQAKPPQASSPHTGHHMDHKE